ncbi:hypothetical protein [Paragemmobacter straminiformis]|uniref:PhoU domain-containing protein n=1 Tax=Paragemmobacter straminiformis TaxID=2045119 RepID=A0A842IAZ5_9RHOB|nr:hypothetical protein [Gemmobacter straminiformis]MBC2836517.1 hypothetical protein [Gemmobacter straminiformis]
MFSATVPTQNTHRILMHSPDQKLPDADRITDLLADAHRALRDAVATAEDLDADDYAQLGDHLALIEALLDRGDLVDDSTSASLMRICAAANVVTDSREADTALLSFVADIQTACILVIRVRDLLDAEAAIQRYRRTRTGKIR